MKCFKKNNVIIRKFEEKDLEDMHYSILTQEEVMDIANEKICTDMTESRIILKSAMNEYYTDEPIWAVEDKNEKKLIGFIKVINYSEKNKICSLTWTIVREYWHTNYMQDALLEVIEYLINKKHIELITSSYYERNSINGYVLDGIGMKKEAVLRERRINENTHEKEDFVIYSISKQEFIENCWKNIQVA